MFIRFDKNAGVLRNCRPAAQRGQGLLRDQRADGRDLHQGGVRSRETGRLRSRGRGPRRCPLRPTQQQRTAQQRSVISLPFDCLFFLYTWTFHSFLHTKAYTLGRLPYISWKFTFTLEGTHTYNGNLLLL